MVSISKKLAQMGYDLLTDMRAMHHDGEMHYVVGTDGKGYVVFRAAPVGKDVSLSAISWYANLENAVSYAHDLTEWWKAYGSAEPDGLWGGYSDDKKVKDDRPKAFGNRRGSSGHLARNYSKRPKQKVGSNSVPNLAFRLVNLYRSVDPYEFEDQYGNDLQRAFSDTLAGLSTPEGVDAAIGVLEDIYRLDDPDMERERVALRYELMNLHQEMGPVGSRNRRSRR